MNSEHTIRPMFLLGLFMCISMIAVALGSQYYLDMDPCPLCIFQRVAVMILGVIFLFGRTTQSCK